MVVILVVRELTDSITGSRIGSLIDFGAIFGNFSRRRKMDDSFSTWRKRKSMPELFTLFCFADHLPPLEFDKKSLHHQIHPRPKTLNELLFSYSSHLR